jgi:folate-dependent phosphoribosylglycinamide formyltransferase PurN
MSQIRIIILSGQGESTKSMINGIKDSFLIEKIIIEEAVSKRKLLLSRIKVLGLAKVIGQTLFMLYNNIWLKGKSQVRINEIKKHANLSNAKLDENIISNVSSINSEETKEILQKYNPDAVVVNGTCIIKKDIIESIEAEFINTHVGITPKYRGVHGGYWALTQGDVENCGVTVHLIDTGIDTGDILYQDIIYPTKEDTFNTYPYMQMVAAIPLMKKAIISVADKTYKVKKVNLSSKLWSHPTIIEYLKYWLLYGVR